MAAKQASSIPCVDCGEIVVKVRRTDKPMVCHACGLTRAILASEEMAAKQGPAWDKWLTSNGAKGRPRRNPDRKV